MLKKIRHSLARKIGAEDPTALHLVHYSEDMFTVIVDHPKMTSHRKKMYSRSLNVHGGFGRYDGDCALQPLHVGHDIENVMMSDCFWSELSLIVKNARCAKKGHRWTHGEVLYVLSKDHAFRHFHVEVCYRCMEVGEHIDVSDFYESLNSDAS